MPPSPHLARAFAPFLLVATVVVPAVVSPAAISPWTFPPALADLAERYAEQAATALTELEAGGEADVSHDGAATPRTALDVATALRRSGVLPEAFEALTEFWARYLFLVARRDIEANGTDPGEAYARVGEAYLASGRAAVPPYRDGLAAALSGDPDPFEFDLLLYSGKYLVIGFLELAKAEALGELATQPGGPNANLTAVHYLGAAFSSWYFVGLAKDIGAVAESLPPADDRRVSRATIAAAVDEAFPAFEAASRIYSGVTPQVKAIGLEMHARRGEGTHYEILFLAADLTLVYTTATEEATLGSSRPGTNRSRPYERGVEEARQELLAGFARAHEAGFAGLGIAHPMVLVDLRGGLSAGPRAAPANFGGTAEALEALAIYGFLANEDGLLPEDVQAPRIAAGAAAAAFIALATIAAAFWMRVLVRR